MDEISDTNHSMTEIDWTTILESINDSLQIKNPNQNIFEELKHQLKTKFEHTYDLWAAAKFNKNHLFQVAIKESILKTTLLNLACKNGLLNVVKQLITMNVELDKTDDRGHTSLWYAVKANSLDIIQALLENGADVNKKGNNGDNVIHLAAFRGNIDIVRYLIDNGADFNVQDNHSFTPVHAAAFAGHLNVIKYFIEVKHMPLNLNVDNQILKYATTKGYKDIVEYIIGDMSPEDINIIYVCPLKKSILHEAAQSGHLELVKYLVEIKQLDMLACDRNKNTPASLAALKGHFNVVNYLIEKNVDLLKLVDCDDGTLLHQSTRSGNIDLIKYLIHEKNLDFMAAVKLHWTYLIIPIWSADKAYKRFDIDDFTNDHELSVLHLAASYGQTEAFKYLTEKVRIDYNICDKERITPLHLAAGKGHLGVIKYLIDDREVDPEFKSRNKLTALHLAAHNGHVDVIKYLVEDKNASIIVRDSKLWTPLYFAAASGHLDAVKYLINKNADVNGRDSKSRTALQYAATEGHLDVVKYLINESNADYKTKDYECYTPFYTAVQKGHLAVIKYFVDELHEKVDYKEHDGDGWTPIYLASISTSHTDVTTSVMDIVKYLVEKGADLDVRTDSDRSCLQGAIFANNLELVKYLIEEMNVNVDTKDVHGHTPVCPAIEMGHLVVAKYLIEERGFHTNVTDVDGRTVLHLAAHSGNSQMVKYLIDERGANEFINSRRTDNNWTPLYEAVCKGYFDITEILLSNGAMVNIGDNHGNLPLHKASQRGDVKIANALLNHGADINAKNNGGHTPLNKAKWNHQKHMVKFLKERGGIIPKR